MHRGRQLQSSQMGLMFLMFQVSIEEILLFVFPICIFGLILGISGLIRGEDDWQLLAIFGIVVSALLLGCSSFMLLFMLFGVD